MKLMMKFLCSLLLLCSGSLCTAATAIKVNISGTIGPASAAHARSAIEYAAKAGAHFLIIELDSADGLDSSIRSIIKAITASSVPVVSYLNSPESRVSGSGVFILYASHLAAMAPTAHLGAPSSHEHPVVASPKTPPQKTTLKARTDIRKLAELHDRKVNWGVAGVDNATALTATAAQQAQIIDIVAKNLTDLREKMDGKTVTLHDQKITLQSKTATIVDYPVSRHTHFLRLITNPNIIYILLMLGIYGLLFELLQPGTLLPGTIGILCLITALYALQLLPINTTGLLLLVLGIAFMIAESALPSFGILGLGGGLAFLFGSFLLFDSPLPHYTLAWPLILFVTLINFGLFSVVVNLALRAQRRQVVAGRESLIGTEGVTLEPICHQGHARIQGERWQIKCEEPLPAGTAVKVTSINGLILTVIPLTHE
jgi:membrane-bound serine protease (ClpP class)